MQVEERQFELIKTMRDNVTVARGGFFAVTGILNGDILVTGGGELVINGTVNGDVEVVNGLARVYGTLNGRISIESGDVEVFGIVKGIEPEGAAIVHTGAFVNGVRM